MSTRTFILSIPWEMRSAAPALGAKYDAKLKAYTYTGSSLPPLLAPFGAKDFSWERWQEDRLNKARLPVTISEHPFAARPHQMEAAKKIASMAKKGHRGFLQADETGLGKTFASILGAYGVAKLKGASPKKRAKILIVCPKSVIPHWRNTLSASPLPPYADIVVINYEQLSKLLEAPASAAQAKKTRTKNRRVANEGKPLVDWDIIIADESQKLKNFQTSQRAKAFSNVAKYSAPDNQAPFIIYASATPAQNPLEMGYLAPVLSKIVGKKLTLKNYGQWLESEGFAVKKGKVGYTWGVVHHRAEEAKKQEMETAKKRDIKKMRDLLFGPSSPSIRRLPTDIAGWPAITRIALPVTLDNKARGLYEEVWSQFRSFLRLHRKGKDPKGGLAQQLRFRQKSSLLRVPGAIDFIADMLDNNLQVAVSIQFLESLDLIRTALEKKGVKCAEYSGRLSSEERDAERLRFQRGEAQVIFFTVTEGISLHAGEQLPDGTEASSTPRVTVVHDIRYSGIENSQLEGRTHRDGQNANVYYIYAQDTVEEKIITVALERMANISSMSGDDDALVEEIEQLIAA